MSFTESIVEDAALEWFGELGYAVGHGPHLAPGEPAAERRIERGTHRLQTGGRAMKPCLPIPTGLRHSAKSCRVGEATLGHLVDYFPQPQRGCISVRARGFNPVGANEPGFRFRSSGFGTRASFGPRISVFGLQCYLATLRNTLLPRLLSGESSVAKIVLSGVNE